MMAFTMLEEQINVHICYYLPGEYCTSYSLSHTNNLLTDVVNLF